MPQQGVHIVHLTMAGAGVSAGSIDLFHDHRRFHEPQPRAAVGFRDQRRHPAGARQRLDKRLGIASANGGGDFPIQNLPFSVFRPKGGDEVFRGGVALGDQVIDLAALVGLQMLEGLAAEAAGVCMRPQLNDFFAMGRGAARALRHGLFALFDETGPADRRALEESLVPQAEAEFSLPARIGDYTDFYTSLDHAQNIGRLFSAAAEVVHPNFHWLPVAYHGRSSSIVPSGHPIRRPIGQSLRPGKRSPSLAASAWLDYELELGVFVGPGNAMGSPVSLESAEAHVFGLCLLNDWSARDIQGWEMPPLGPFLAKNFATTLSPWVVTMDALEPFRAPWRRAPDVPGPLTYLDGRDNRERGAVDIQLEVCIQTRARRAAGLGEVRLSQTSFRHQHWTIAQMLAHHTVGGCNLRSGDLLGTGTISGPTPSEAGAMMELSRAGRQPVSFGADDGLPEQRAFVEDHDSITLRGWCHRPGFRRIGLGECRGDVLPALPMMDSTRSGKPAM